MASTRRYEDFRTELQSYREKAKLFGGKEPIEKLHSEGRMTARERIDQQKVSLGIIEERLARVRGKKLRKTAG